jgi:hypothetical protein
VLEIVITIFTKPDPLTDFELDRLGAFLGGGSQPGTFRKPCEKAVRK